MFPDRQRDISWVLSPCLSSQSDLPEAPPEGPGVLQPEPNRRQAVTLHVCLCAHPAWGFFPPKQNKEIKSLHSKSAINLATDVSRLKRHTWSRIPWFFGLHPCVFAHLIVFINVCFQLQHSGSECFQHKQTHPQTFDWSHSHFFMCVLPESGTQSFQTECCDSCGALRRGELTSDGECGGVQGDVQEASLRLNLWRSSSSYSSASSSAQGLSLAFLVIDRLLIIRLLLLLLLDY